MVQICDRSSQSSASRGLLKQNGRRRLPENEEGKAWYSTPPPPPPPLLNFLGEKPPLRHTNGYSIAEILLVFGIIAGVLIGVWAMYTMLGDKSDAQTAVAEIQMLRKAAAEYKHAPGHDNKYSGVTLISTLKPYLGQSGLSDGQNVFGQTVSIIPENNDRDLKVTYQGVRDLDICRQILNYFGEINPTDAEDLGMGVTVSAISIPRGHTISGYVGGMGSTDTGCRENPSTKAYTLSILID